MDLANMRQNRSLEVAGFGCRHEVMVNVDNYPERPPGEGIRPAHGLHQVRHGRRRRPAELEGAEEVMHRTLSGGAGGLCFLAQLSSIELTNQKMPLLSVNPFGRRPTSPPAANKRPKVARSI
jgi:hypothetical protein